MKNKSFLIIFLVVACVCVVSVLHCVSALGEFEQGNALQSETQGSSQKEAIRLQLQLTGKPMASWSILK